MIRIKRAAITAEIMAALRIGAVCDLWAAKAAQRLGELSRDFPEASPCEDAAPSYQPEAPDFDTIPAPGAAAIVILASLATCGALLWWLL